MYVKVLTERVDIERLARDPFVNLPDLDLNQVVRIEVRYTDFTDEMEYTEFDVYGPNDMKMAHRLVPGY